VFGDFGSPIPASIPLDVRFKHVAQSIRKGVARVRYVSTKWNYADLMTKPLAKLEFKRLRDLCLLPESGVTGHPSMEHRLRG